VGAIAPLRARAQQIRPIRLTDISGYVELEATHDREERSRSGAETSSDREERRLQPRLRLNLDGYVYHPRFLKYSGGGDVALVQEFGDREGNDSLLLSGDWNLKLLPEHDYSLSLFGHAGETEISRPFASNYDVSSSGYGAAFSYRRAPLPFVLTYRHSDQEGSPFGRNTDREGDETWISTRYSLGENTQGTLRYEWTQEDVGERSIDREAFYATNRTLFENGARLFTNFRFDEISDLSDSTRHHATSGLHWPLGSSLSSQSRVSFRRSETNGQTVNTWGIGSVLQHQLYESLTSNFTLAGKLEDASFGTTTEQGATLQENYGKRIGSSSSISIDFGTHAEIESRRPERRTAFVVDETHVLQGLLPVELDRPDAELDSIVVTSADRSIVFIDGLDYTLRQLGLFVELRRLATGDIVDGEAVLVDYNYRLAEGDVLDTGFNFRANLLLGRRLNFYYSITRNHQTEVSGNPDARLQSRDRQVMGVGFLQDRMSASVAFERDESEIHGIRVESELTGFQALSQELSFRTPPSWRWSGSVSGSHRKHKFLHSDDRFTSLALGARAGVPVLARATFEVSAEYLKERWSGAEDSERNDSEAMSIRARLTWYFPMLEVRLEGRLARVERFGQDETVDQLHLRLRRVF
jgi:hypothetical protein